MDEDKLVLTVEEAAQLLRVSRAFTYELLNRGELPCIRLGRRLLVPRRALERFIEERPAAAGERR
jgi:excisionase family DNA binding protein